MRLRKPKIAIVTDWIVDMGGQARVDLALHEAFPDAPIYTSVYEPDAMAREHFKDLDIRTTELQKLPRLLRRFHRFIPMMRVRAFRKLDLSEYDVIISSSSAESKQVRKTRPGQVHISYCHTPIRYYWSHKKQYLKDPGFGIFNWPARIGLTLMHPYLKKADYDAAQKVDTFIANSTEVQSRIKKYYGRSSTVVHPPVDTKRFAPYAKPLEQRHHFIALGRQVPYKRIDLAVAACTTLGLPLIVVGNGPEHKRLQAMAGPSVSFETNASDERVAELLGSARGFIFPAFEDFGIVQVEALSAGTPVIAYGHGGALDIIEHGMSGIVFNHQSVESLIDGLSDFNDTPFHPQASQRVAKRFDEVLFISKIQKIVRDAAS